MACKSATVANLPVARASAGVVFEGQEMRVFDAELDARMNRAQERYGDFSSTHEAMGVALEEWDEFRAAVHTNDHAHVMDECIDLAAVLLRLYECLDRGGPILDRSVK